MNTTFNPSTFDKQAAASLDMMDEQAAAERAQRILHPEPQGARSQAQAGPTLTPQPQTHPQAPATRKKRSDAGVPKKPSTTATLTIQFDLSDTGGRELFAKTLKFWAENGNMEAVQQIAEQFAKKVESMHRQAPK